MKSYVVFSSICCLFTAAHAVNIGNLNKCVEDVKKSLATSPPETSYFSTNYQQLLQMLQSPQVRDALPVVYQQNFLNPLIAYLKSLGPSRFYTLFSQQARDELSAFLQQIIPDLTEAVAQNGLGYAEKPLNAFEEVISDLYDGFLSEEDRISNETGVKIKPPDRGILAPLAKWGNPDAGPYTWPGDATAELSVKAGIVSLPPAHMKGGILAWSALGHETGGHDLLHADTGLIDELGSRVYNAVVANGGSTFLATYWRNCIDETASDVLGVLNMGPAAAIGLVGYFRGLTGGKLRTQGPLTGPHPIDILRGYLGAEVVSQLSFAGAGEWSQAIENEVNKDLQTIYIVDSRTGYYYRIPADQALQSVKVAANTIMNTKLNALEGHSLKEIQDWTDADQKIVSELGVLLHKANADLPASFKTHGYYATHLVAAGVQEALEKGANVQVLFDRMIKHLNTMHQYNKTWKKPTSSSAVDADAEESQEEAPLSA
ncbi:MAG: hypothetical protein JSR76_02240 [Verrucomicrobia bacterium]|nr:hypothetical protein [Verrucomicrobiota bacterium]